MDALQQQLTYLERRRKHCAWHTLNANLHVCSCSSSNSPGEVARWHEGASAAAAPKSRSVASTATPCHGLTVCMLSAAADKAALERQLAGMDALQQQLTEAHNRASALKEMADASAATAAKNAELQADLITVEQASSVSG